MPTVLDANCLMICLMLVCLMAVELVRLSIPFDPLELNSTR
jgi:hypothetical protein